jgi:hypothetical protein
METKLRLRIVLEKPPPGVDFGLQEGKGRDYKTVDKQRSKGKNLTFTCTVTVKDNREDGLPNFLGPMAQGPSGARFIYLDIGEYAGQTNCPWSRRLKVPLSGITWREIEQVRAEPTLILESRVPGTGKDGGPSCATVKPFDGWRLLPGSRTE